MTARRLVVSGAVIALLFVASPLFAQDAPVLKTEKARPSIMMLSAYMITALVQGLDAHSTFKALDAGAGETNPFLINIARNRAAFIALKVAIATGLIYEGRGLAKKQKVVSVLTLAAINGVYIALAEQNYRVARQMRSR